LFTIYGFFDGAILMVDNWYVLENGTYLDAVSIEA
jgi:hypothetical protein